VGQVDVVEIQGLKLWFNSSDHTPPHLHVSRRGKWEIRVMILECTEGTLVYDLKWGRSGPPSSDRAQILQAVLEHREALLQEWEVKVCISN
jgi:Domain of unknown function (DUF4160)